MDFILIHKRLFMIGGICLIFIVFLLYLISSNVNMDDNQIVVDSIDVEVVKYYVDIKGEVNSPGVYEVDSSMIVNDVVDLAGGLTEYADVSTINLASKVTDGMFINILSRKLTDSDDKISINSADINDFMMIPGIGESKAKAIVDYRLSIGFFSKIEDLLNVSGIGEATLENIRDYITL